MILADTDDLRQRVARMLAENDAAGSPLSDDQYLADAAALLDLVKVAQLVAMLRECQSALTGPASLRQRIEDLIGPRHERPFPEGE